MRTVGQKSGERFNRRTTKGGKVAAALGRRRRREELMFFLCSEFSSPCQASTAIFKPSLPINPSSFLTDGGWVGGWREGKKNKGGRKTDTRQTKKGGGGGGGGEEGLGVLTNIHAHA